MKATVHFGFGKEKWTEVSITGHDNVTMPVLKYLLNTAANKKAHLVLVFKKEEENK